MKLYNVLSQTVEPFAPQTNPVSIYVCGITPYDTTHLGHAFTYVAFDILIRYLEYKGHPVRYVQNVTDIDDDILRKANQAGDDWQALGNRWTAHFIRDMQILNVRPPDHFPRATEFIPQIIEAVQRLLAAGAAYEANGNVYFSVDAWPRFGQLSGLPKDEMLPIANERGNRPDDPHKRQPLDFVLWQAQAPGEPAWESPWGLGRPGWHIECSTMSTGLLGPSVDIHGGGGDLVFPHHECEIAQAECATGHSPFVRVWLHAAMVYHEGEKMSKSLGNLVMARDLLGEFSADALRLYLAGHHYRQSWSYDAAALHQAQALADTLTAAAAAPSGSGSPAAIAGAVMAFETAMDNDLDTSTALMALAHLADRISAASVAGGSVRPAQDTLRGLGRVFGLRLGVAEPEDRVVAGWSAHLKKFETG